MTRPRTAPAARGGSPTDRTNLYDEITAKIIAELEAGRLPLVQPWGMSSVTARLALPKSATTVRRYSGINVLILWGAVVERGFSGQSWLTFGQALTLDGNVRKGERGTTVVYADRFVSGEEREHAQETGKDARAIHCLKRFTVFNAEQCDGLPEGITVAAPPVETALIDLQVQALIDASKVGLRIGGERAYYDVAVDFVRVPPPKAYFQTTDWHRTAQHELIHWSGAAHRLARDLAGGFGSKKYALEELVGDGSGLHLRLARYRADRPLRGLYRRLARHPARGQPRHHLRRQRGIQGSRLPADLRVRRSARVLRDGRCGGRVVTGAVSPSAPASTQDVEERYGIYIADALAIEGGHLAIGRGGFMLHFGRGARLSPHDCETIKTACIATGHTVIDSRRLRFNEANRLAVHGPMVAVLEPADPQPWGAFSYAPLAAVAEAYRAAGAEVLNLPPASRAGRGE